MTERDEQLKRQFEQLPDPAAPLGLDTRIQAAARAELERRRPRVPWRAGFASAACLLLAVLIARPLLEQPLSPDAELSRPVQNLGDEAFAPAEIEAIQTLPQFAAEPHAAQGGGALPELADELTEEFAADLLQDAPMAAERASDQEMQPARARAAKAQPAAASAPVPARAAPTQEVKRLASPAPRPELEALLEQLAQADGDAAERERLLDLIERHYPEHYRRHLAP